MEAGVEETDPLWIHKRSTEIIETMTVEQDTLCGASWKTCDAELHTDIGKKLALYHKPF